MNKSYAMQDFKVIDKINLLRINLVDKRPILQIQEILLQYFNKQIYPLQIFYSTC